MPDIAGSCSNKHCSVVKVLCSERSNVMGLGCCEQHCNSQHALHYSMQQGRCASVEPSTWRECVLWVCTRHATNSVKLSGNGCASNEHCGMVHLLDGCGCVGKDTLRTKLLVCCGLLNHLMDALLLQPLLLCLCCLTCFHLLRQHRVRGLMTL